MREIHLIDTSALCRVLNVPNMCSAQEHREAFGELARLTQRDITLLLPVATVYETGNHIAQYGSGGQRRSAAQKFIGFVQAFPTCRPGPPLPCPTRNK